MRKCFAGSNLQARRYIESATRRVTPTERVDVVSDPPDNRILECAETAASEFIVTGDKHLLRLGRYPDRDVGRFSGRFRGQPAR